MSRDPILVIVGPTAVGKTELAVKVAQRLNAEIISADSMQIYRGMDVGTAKPTPEEQGGIVHHMIDVVDPDQDFTVAQYQEMVEEILASISARGKRALLTGGTGLYVKAVIDGFDFPAQPEDFQLRRQLQQIAQTQGPKALHDKLQRVDPVSARRLHPNDVRRVIRALEVYEVTGTPLSELLERQEHRPPRHEALFFGLTRPREELYLRCDQRVDLMLEQGLLDEVKQLLERGFDQRGTALQAIGYKELIGYLQGQYDWEEGIRLLKRNTRRYAKRQYTWFLRDRRIQWIDVSTVGPEQAVEEIVSEYQRRAAKDSES